MNDRHSVWQRLELFQRLLLLTLTDGFLVLLAIRAAPVVAYCRNYDPPLIAKPACRIWEPLCEQVSSLPTLETRVNSGF